MSRRSGRKTVSRPQMYLLRMVLFITLVGFLALILYQPITEAFRTNPALNGLIIFTLVIGIIYGFRQVTRLSPEVRWVNAFSTGAPGLVPQNTPALLAPMAVMLRDRTGPLSLSASSMRIILDSVGSRLDEGRDTLRYLVGLLVFLGLLGTFWGLLETIQSVGLTIKSLDTSGQDSLVIFEELKRGLEAPLSGMGTAFSSSLFGLSGSLVLGFLDLQAGQAHNRFYNELEEWLSGVTDIEEGEGTTDGVPAQLSYVMARLQTNLNELGTRLETAITEDDSKDSVRALAKSIEQLVTQMRNEQTLIRGWVDEQAQAQAELAAVLRDLNQKSKTW